MQPPSEISWEEVEDIPKGAADGFEFYHRDFPDEPLAALIGFSWTIGDPALVRIRRPRDDRMKRAIEEVRALIEDNMKGAKRGDRNVTIWANTS